MGTGGAGTDRDIGSVHPTTPGGMRQLWSVADDAALARFLPRPVVRAKLSEVREAPT